MGRREALISASLVRAHTRAASLLIGYMHLNMSQTDHKPANRCAKGNRTVKKMSREVGRGNTGRLLKDKVIYKILQTTMCGCDQNAHIRASAGMR